MTSRPLYYDVTTLSTLAVAGRPWTIPDCEKQEARNGLANLRAGMTAAKAYLDIPQVLVRVEVLLVISGLVFMSVFSLFLVDKVSFFPLFSPLHVTFFFFLCIVYNNRSTCFEF